MSTHNICFQGEIRRYQYFWFEKKKILSSALLERLFPEIITHMICIVRKRLSGLPLNQSSLRKRAYSNILKILPPKTENF